MRFSSRNSSSSVAAGNLPDPSPSMSYFFVIRLPARPVVRECSDPSSLGRLDVVCLASGRSNQELCRVLRAYETPFLDCRY
jgi:hypothetical protein